MGGVVPGLFLIPTGVRLGTQVGGSGRGSGVFVLSCLSSWTIASSRAPQELRGGGGRGAAAPMGPGAVGVRPGTGPLLVVTGPGPGPSPLPLCCLSRLGRGCMAWRGGNLEEKGGAERRAGAGGGGSEGGREREGGEGEKENRGRGRGGGRRGEGREGGERQGIEGERDGGGEGELEREKERGGGEGWEGGVRKAGETEKWEGGWRGGEGTSLSSSPCAVGGSTALLLSAPVPSAAGCRGGVATAGVCVAAGRLTAVLSSALVAGAAGCVGGAVGAGVGGAPSVRTCTLVTSARACGGTVWPGSTPCSAGWLDVKFDDKKAWALLIVPVLSLRPRFLAAQVTATSNGPPHSRFGKFARSCISLSILSS